ncbi:hypothetical protein OC835_007825 [Tilletia horrida]|nr:hypothetical protein OC835_007825 [Tilletia horrida]
MSEANAFWYGECWSLDAAAFDLTADSPSDEGFHHFSQQLGKHIPRFEPLSQVPALSQLSSLFHLPGSTPASRPIAASVQPAVSAPSIPSPRPTPSSSPLSSPPVQVAALFDGTRASASDTSDTSSDEDAFPVPPSAQPRRSDPAQDSVPRRSARRQHQHLADEQLTHPSLAQLPRNDSHAPAEHSLQHTHQADGQSAFSGSQLCLNLIEPELRTAYTVAYQTAKQHVKKGTLPDWERVWYENGLSSYDSEVRALVRRYFDGVIQSFLLRARTQSPTSGGASSSATAAAPPSTGPLSLSAPSPIQRSPPHNAAVRSAGSASEALRPINCNTSKIGNTVEMPKEALLTLSKRARNAVAKGGEWHGFDYVGVVRWRRGAVEEKAITYALWCEEHEEPRVSGEQASKSRGKVKAADTGKAATTGAVAKPSRARQYDAYRERWECRTCLSQLHEGVGRTGNLTKHRAKCSAAVEAAR